MITPVSSRGEHSRHSSRGSDERRGRNSRRDFLGLLGGVAVASAAGVTVDKVVSGGHPADAAARRPAPRTVRPKVVAENDLPGYPGWQITNVGGTYDIVGFVNPTVVSQGQPVTLYASTGARSYTVKVFRMGWYHGDGARLVYSSPAVKGLVQAAPTLISGTNTVTTDWGPSLTLQTDDWPPGAYLLRLDAANGSQRYVPMTVRSPDFKGKVVLKASTATWQAYNLFWGYDLYQGPAGASDYDNRSLVVSMDRPYDTNGAVMFLAHEQPLIQVAESLGLPLAYISSVEIDNDPTLLNGASALFSLGHDEYWSYNERMNVTAARDAGVNLAFMGANCCFRRIRYQDSPLGAQRQVICYKTSYTEDPMYGVNNAIVTDDWREPPDPNPESSMTGTLYESNPTDASYVVATPESWVFAGTGVQKGTSLPGLVGIEYDRVNPDVTVERPIQILSHSPLTCRGINSYSDSAYYTTSSGAGVFNAGSMRFVGSIDWQSYTEFGVTAAVSTFVTQVCKNLLLAFADGPAAAKYPAEDNLDYMQEYAGDPIANEHNLWPPVVL
jgi:hypothetical protein